VKEEIEFGGRKQVPSEKDGNARRKLSKELQRGLETLLCGRGLKAFFTPKKY